MQTILTEILQHISLLEVDEEEHRARMEVLMDVQGDVNVEADIEMEMFDMAPSFRQNETIEVVVDGEF